MQPIFHASAGVHVLAVQIGKFADDMVKFETFGMQEFHDVTLLEFHQSRTFQFSTIYVVAFAGRFFSGKFQIFTESINLAELLMGAAWTLQGKENPIMINKLVFKREDQEFGRISECIQKN
jgi:hypothetical protein